MSNGKDPAYPFREFTPDGQIDWGNIQSGMTKREYFIGQALTGIAATAASPLSGDRFDQARYCIGLADALLEILSKEPRI